MNNTPLLDISISYFPAKECKSNAELLIGNVLSYIKNGKYQNIIEAIRRDIAIGEIDRAKQNKSKLPAVTFSGLYPEYRRDGYCAQYNYLMVIDIDNLSHEQIETVKEQLQNDPFVASFWKSPSGNGYKGLIRLSYGNQYENVNIRDKHKFAFMALYEYMFASYGIELDKSGSDPTRLCFMSYDPDLFIKNSTEDFIVNIENLQLVTKEQRINEVENLMIAQERVTYNEYDWNRLIGQKWDFQDHSRNKQTIYFLLRKMKKKNISITSTFEEWVKVAYAIANSLHPAVGKSVFMQMCELDGPGHNHKSSERLIYDAYRRNSGKVHFETIIYIAKQKGVIV